MIKKYRIVLFMGDNKSETVSLTKTQIKQMLALFKTDLPNALGWTGFDISNYVYDEELN